MSERKICRNCSCRPATRSRGLCFACYSDAAVRDRYPSALPQYDDGSEGEQVPPPEPTEYLPGSAEKIGVLEGRARRREQLFHPADAKVRAGVERCDLVANPCHQAHHYSVRRYGVRRYFGRWLAFRKFNGRTLRIGIYATRQEAALALEATRSTHVA